MDPLKYRDLFYLIACKNKAILNDPDKNDRFFEVLRSFNPVEMVWDSDFTSSLRSRINLKDNKCIMVLEAMEGMYRNNGGEDKQFVFSGCFIILKKINSEKTHYPIRDASVAQKDAMIVAQSILGYLEEHNTRSWDNGQMKESIYLYWDSVNFLPVGGDLQGMAGYRVEFDFKSPANSEVVYDPDDWTEPLP